MFKNDGPGHTPPTQFRGLVCAVLVYSVTDKNSLFHVQTWKHELETRRDQECKQNHIMCKSELTEFCNKLWCIVECGTNINLGEAGHNRPTFIAGYGQDYSLDHFKRFLIMYK